MRSVWGECAWARQDEEEEGEGWEGGERRIEVDARGGETMLDVAEMRVDGDKRGKPGDGGERMETRRSGLRGERRKEVREGDR